jgi:hypothetical protein
MTSQGLHVWWLAPMAALLFLTGVLLLIKAKRIQDLVIRKMDLDPFEDYVKSTTYLLQLRIVGVVEIAVSLFLAYAAYANR